MATMTDLFAGGVTKITSGSSLVTGTVIRAVPSLFYGCDGRNTSTAAVVYIWICDTTSVGAITAANVVHIIGVPASSAASPNLGNFGIETSGFGELYTQGIVIAGSSTDFPTFTLLGTASLFISCASALEYGQY